MSSTGRHALVFGASGLIGRHLVLALHAAGVRVSTASRSTASFARLRAWLANHGLDDAPTDLRVDFDADHPLGTKSAAWEDITEIHNCAGSYQFGMGIEEARHANVGSVEAVLCVAAMLPKLRRVVHVSGYRVGGQNPKQVPWDRALTERTYRALGAYEASKVESDAVFQARANELNIPWSIVNPSSVIGDSGTGESDQFLGLAGSVKEIWQGTMSALPGNARTFVPVVAVDHVARFMAMLPTDAETVGQSYWLLDDRTPALPDLLTRIGRHFGVSVPRIRIPVPVIKMLPRSIIKADPETLTFLSEDRYPTEPARMLAARHGLEMPDTMTTIFRWADHLAAQRFGDAAGPDRHFTDIAGIRSFELGHAGARVILPGLPINADSWATVAEAIGGTRVIDLPGLGMSGGTSPRDWATWLDALVGNSEPIHLIGHSIGAAAALEAAARRPDRVTRLTLVSPFFLQPPGGLSTRIIPLIAAYLRRTNHLALARRLTGRDDDADRLRSSVADLRRGKTSWRVATLLAHASNPRWRGDLLQKLVQYQGYVNLIVGANDPLTEKCRRSLSSISRISVATIPGAGHHPHITHPGEVARAILENSMKAEARANGVNLDSERCL
ncbi:alpha/beta fold hydrolase [Sphingopyxis sp. 550A]